MAVLIAATTSATNSADFTLASGDNVTLALVAAAAIPSDAAAAIQFKSAGGVYFNIGNLTQESPAKVLSAPGTFRVVLTAASVAVGVDKV